MYSYASGYSGSETLFGSSVANSNTIISTNPSRFAIGSRDNIPLQLGTYDAVGLQISPVPSGVNYIDISGAQTGSGVSISAVGADSDINVVLTPKGTGWVYMSELLYDKSPVAGYILTSDASGIASWSNPTGGVLPLGLTGVGGQPLVWNGSAWVAASSTNFTLNVGRNAGSASTADYCTNLGTAAGESGQGVNNVAIGVNAGQVSQGTLSTAVGFLSQTLLAGTNATSIGAYSSQQNAGNYSVSVGYAACASPNNAGTNSVSVGAFANAVNNNSIVLNSTGSALTSAQDDAFYVSSVRFNNSSVDNILCWNTTGLRR
jgi:hypothetical protein